MIQRNIDPLGRLSIPKEMRDAIGLDVGKPASIDMKDGQIIITNPSKNDAIDKLIKRFEGSDDLSYSGNDIAYILKQEFNR